MRVFLDTNVLLDVLTRRKPHWEPASEVWARVEAGKIEGHISAISFNNVHCVIRRASGKAAANTALKVLHGLFHVVPLDERIIRQAIDADFADFEDAIQFFSAHHAKVDSLLTRDLRHFPTSSLSVVTPEEFLKGVGA